MKLGVFVASLPPELRGGTEIQAERMAREMSARGHDVHVFSRKQSSHPEPNRGGVHVSRRAVVPIPGLRPLAELFLGVRQALVARCDVLLCYITLNSGVLGWLTHQVTRVPFVIWVRGVDEVQLASRPGIRSRVCLFLYERAGEVWLQSQSIAQEMQQELESLGKGAAWRHIEPRIRIMSNGLDVPVATTSALPDRNRFVFVGRLVAEKDLKTLFDAVQKFPEVRLAVIGDGPLRQQLQSLADPDRVEFHGTLDRQAIDAKLLASRALVLCSVSEGLPNVVLEALAQGRPVIATGVGAIPELIEDGVNGYLVKPGDSEAIVEAMRKLQDDERWHRMASQSRGSVEKFAWPRLVGEVEQHLEALRSPQA